MDAARPHGQAVLQEVDDRRMTQAILPSPNKILSYKSEPLSAPGELRAPNESKHGGFNISIKRMESAECSSAELNPHPPTTKPSVSPKNLLLDQNTIQETEEENESSIYSQAISGKSK